MTTRQRHIAHLHLHAALTEAQYDDVTELMSGITPHVQTVPPDAVQLDLTSALRYFDLSPYDVLQLAKMRLKLFYGIDSSAGLANNRMLAAMAADASAPGDTTWIPAGQAATWLYPRPVTALPGIGRATAETLSRYGLHTIGTAHHRDCTPSARSPTSPRRPCNDFSEPARHGCWPSAPAAAIPVRSARRNRQRTWSPTTCWSGTASIRRGITERCWASPTRSAGACAVKARSPADSPSPCGTPTAAPPRAHAPCRNRPATHRPLPRPP